MSRPRLGKTAIRVALLLSALAPAVPGWAQAPERVQALPRGEIVDRLACRADPAKSYALYLPSAYTPERSWPALFLLDPRGRGRRAAERFQAAAERYGWVLVSSNDSASDAGWEEIRGPAAAILTDAPERIAIDSRRVYLGGFSGTARGAGALAANAAGAITGVFLAGAGLPAELPLDGLPFAVFAAAGREDFNFHEVDALAEPLAAAGVRHRIEFFDGPHAWPPAELAAAALGWFELRSMAAGARSFDPALAAELAAGWLAEAAARERAGDPIGAWRLFRATAADLADLGAADPGRRLGGLRAEAEGAAERLGVSAELRRAAAERRRLAAWELERRRELDQVLAPLGRLDDLPPADTRARGERLIGRLQAEAAAGGAEAPAARRALAYAAAQAGFYLPRDLLARGEYRRAAVALELAVLIRADDVTAWYNLACARARLGQERLALDALESAVAAGYRDAAHMAADPDLQSLRGDDRFVALLARAGEPAG